MSLQYDFDNAPTFTAVSDRPLTVEIGGGIFGFASVAAYVPQERRDWGMGLDKVRTLSLNPRGREVFGVGFDYDSTARVSVDGIREWTNRRLTGAPSGRQDVCKTGMLDIKLFKLSDITQFVEANREALKRLGLDFIGL